MYGSEDLIAVQPDFSVARRREMDDERSDGLVLCDGSMNDDHMSQLLLRLQCGESTFKRSIRDDLVKEL